MQSLMTGAIALQACATKTLAFSAPGRVAYLFVVWSYHE
jgi:hypothetical protein